MFYSIGEFSKLTNLTQKMLKLYQDKELLIPAKVDEFSKYRYYSESNLETAKLINFFKQFDLSLAEIKEIVDNQDDESVLAELLEKQKDVIEDKITKYNFVMGLINEKLKRSTTMTEINNTSKQRSRFWKIFANLLRQKVTIIDSLKIASKSADEEVKSIIKEIIEGVKKGNKLYELLNNNKTVFTRFEILVIYSGEESDKLAQVSNKVGIHIEEVGLPYKVEGEKNTRSKYWKTFALLIESGITITQSLKEASEWADEKLRSVIDQMIEEIINMSTLMDTLNSRPEIFTELERETVRIGEESGHFEAFIGMLPNVVKMKEEAESEEEKRKNYWKVLGYFEGEDFESTDNTTYNHYLKHVEKFNEKNETNKKIKLLDRNVFHLFQDALHLALFVADDKLKTIYEEVLKDISDNKTLSSAMQKYPDIFQEFEIRFIALGESNKDIGKAALELVEVL
ncbi:MAG: type II secretion system F family protein [Candidatus Delongbacteria bacterium]|jgi:type II secretory pathway component PulF|nr:type II secretion system F family protein [Candidatus Delongbacteria bacterium]